ncbi:hypothetical protein ACJMK2_032561 [Sinanodonta woodiana]|uniref:SWIM-type domain-containing protein n=1 Tax=Sinanodonta woodiana TaxID=1069815 RepID=A0ABD3X5P5_SINWO
MISNFMAGYVKELQIMKDIVLDIDSEYYLSPCTCDTPALHKEIPCKQFAIPIRSHFASDKGYVCSEKLDIKQNKQEAELAQADWLCYIATRLKEGENVISYVSSGDIDIIPIHILAISLYLPRKDDGIFKNNVYVVIKKPGSAGKLDIYNITGIVRALEMRYNEDKIAVVLSFSLSLGGNDFIPKFYEISHEKWLKGIFENETFRRNLFKIRSRPDSGHLSVTIDPGVYISLLKNFYCPNKHDAERLSLEEVRQLSIKLPGKDVRSPKLWMPPISALHSICKLINSCLQYLLTAGVSEAELPNFMEGGGLKKVGDVVEYELGPHVHCDNIEDLLRNPEEDLKEALTRARMRRQRKRELNETPGKERQPRKRKLITSTPRKRRDV